MQLTPSVEDLPLVFCGKIRERYRKSLLVDISTESCTNRSLGLLGPRGFSRRSRILYLDSPEFEYETNKMSHALVLSKWLLECLLLYMLSSLAEELH